ncbi:hypothetical protein HRI_004198500 [Hibiscus trionum]|uniref:Uncharacterized protein n=1 Tax=Hibiscus trionum TaxID=183268 RepID=A0A9W7J2N2_HIBTR|nr:hypothetical protein HRI_004198500 [Hibiscus trionum]
MESVLSKVSGPFVNNEADQSMEEALTSKGSGCIDQDKGKRCKAKLSKDDRMEKDRKYRQKKRRAFERMTEEIEQLKESITQMQSNQQLSAPILEKLESYFSQSTSQQHDVKGVSVQIEYLQDIRQLSTENRQLKEEIGLLITENRQLKEESGQLSTKNRLIKEESGLLSTENRQSKEEIGLLITENRQLKEESGQLSTKNRLIKEESGQLSTENGLLKEEIGRLSIENRHLKEENSLLKLEIEHLADVIKGLQGKSQILEVPQRQDSRISQPKCQNGRHMENFGNEEAVVGIELERMTPKNSFLKSEFSRLTDEIRRLQEDITWLRPNWHFPDQDLNKLGEHFFQSTSQQHDDDKSGSVQSCGFQLREGIQDVQKTGSSDAATNQNHT